MKSGDSHQGCASFQHCHCVVGSCAISIFDTPHLVFHCRTNVFPHALVFAPSPCIVTRSNKLVYNVHQVSPRNRCSSVSILADETGAAGGQEGSHYNLPLSWHKIQDHGPDVSPFQNNFGGIKIIFSSSAVIFSEAYHTNNERTQTVPKHSMFLVLLTLKVISFVLLSFSAPHVTLICAAFKRDQR